MAATYRHREGGSITSEVIAVRTEPAQADRRQPHKEVHMADVETTIERWFTALNETDGERRVALVEAAFTEDGRWVDPPFEGQGHEAINGMVDAVYQQFPDHRFRRASAIDAHHDTLRIGWELVSPDGDVVIAGTDIATVGNDGRLERVTGFFGPLPAEAAA
jgi:hypothetical protein